MNPLEILLIAGLVILMLFRRFQGSPLQVRSMVMPLALTVWGASQLVGQPFGVLDIVVLAVDVLIGLAAGAARGLTVHVYERDGHLWQRYRWTTIVVWILTIVLRIGMTIGGNLIGANLPTSATLILLLGASFLAEALVVGERARRTGLPFAPGRRGSLIGSR